MRTHASWPRISLTVASGGVLFISGCLAALERTLDLVLAPAATQNLLQIPQSGLADLIQFFASIVARV
jgi:hypothetical protein